MKQKIDWDEIEFEDFPSEVIDYIISNSSKQQIMVNSINFCEEDFVEADSKLIHNSVWLPKAKVNIDEGIVWFNGENESAIKKWLYYIGAENEAEVIWYDGTNFLYGNIDSSRLSRFSKEEEEEED